MSLTEQDQANLNRISELLAELKPLVENAEKLLAKNTIAQTEWKPTRNEIYFYIDSCINIERSINCNHRSDNELILAGNCFPTKEAAQIAADKIKQLLTTL